MTSSTGTMTSIAHAGGSLVRQVRSAIEPSAPAAGSGQPASGWLVVTLCCQPSDVDPAALPAPLAELGDQIEVRIRPGSGRQGHRVGRQAADQTSSGTKVSRLSGKDPQADLRSALRRAKQLIEVGEVLAVDPAPHGKRSASIGGVLLEAWTKVAPKAGVR